MVTHYTIEHFGKRIRELRLSRNWSLAQLEELSGINRRYLKKIEEGTAKQVRLIHIEKFAKCFETTMYGILNFNK